MKLLWGDIHNHNELGYGQGSLGRSYEIAKSHLDFYAFTPHAQHADGNAPEGYPIVNENWEAIQQAASTHYAPSLFTTFLAYEWHSRKWGHVHVVYQDDMRPLHFAPSLEALQEIHRSERSILVPHHIAYDQGVDWDALDRDLSPVVEVYSEHGSSERDGGLHPMLGHSGGPGSARYTAQGGLAMGHRVGFTAGTDNHDGFPGAYGLGLTAVWAEENTRGHVMEAIRARRTYGVTGDRIEVSFTVNGQQMGSVVEPGDAEIAFEVVGRDEIALVELIRDGKTVEAWAPASSGQPESADDTYRFRVEYGWGPMKGYHIYAWTGALEVVDGEWLNPVPCFASDPFDEHRRKEVGDHLMNTIRWQSHTSRGGAFTTRNSNTVSSANDAVCFEVQGTEHTCLKLDMSCHAQNSIVSTAVDWGTANHKGTVNQEVTIGELLDGRVAIPMGRPSSWIVMHRAHKKTKLTMSGGCTFSNCDDGYVYLRVTQANGQMAWSSPICFGEEKT